MGKHQLILGGQGVKFVGRSQEGLAGDLGNGVGHLRVKPGRRVQPGTHSSTAQRQLFQRRQRQQQQLLVPLQAGAPPGDLLRKGDRGGVLQMRAAGFDHAAVVLLQPAHGGAQPVDGRDHPILKGQHRGNVHGGGKGVVGRLGHVHIVVGVEQRLSGQSIAAVGHHLVGVHIGLGTRSGLPDHQREMVIQLSVYDLVAGPADGIPLFSGHPLRPQSVVGHGGSLLQNAESVDNLLRHGFDADADGEIHAGTLCLRAPISVRRDLHLAHRIMFRAVFHIAPSL